MRDTLQAILMTLLLVGGIAPAVGQTISTVAPSVLPRDSSTLIVVRGGDLAATTGVSVEGTDLTVSSFLATDSLVSFEVGVGARAELGARDLTFEGVGVVVEDAVLVTQGSVRLFSIAPDTGERGRTYSLTVAGSNLDGVVEWGLGEGVTVRSFSASSATAAQLEIEIGPDAFAGPRRVVAVSERGEAALEAGFVISGGEPALSLVSPAALARGQAASLAISGSNLDEVDSISFGPRVSVVDFSVVSPSQATADVVVRDDASAGSRAVTLRTSAEEFFDFPGVFTVLRGPMEVFSLRPTLLRQGDVAFLTIEGINLDGLTEFSAGSGIAVEAIQASTPTSITVDVSVSLSAPIGPRDLTFRGPAGELLVQDGLVIAAYEAPALALKVPEELVVGDVQVGALGRAGLEIENRGSAEEAVELVPVAGDDESFWLRDALGARSERVTVRIAPGARETITVEFEPMLRGRTGVEYAVLARGGAEELLPVVVRGNGTRRQLEFSLPNPYDFGVLSGEGHVELSRLDTLLSDGVPSRSTEIVGLEVRLTLDGQPVSVESIETGLESTLSGSEFWWGNTDLTWSHSGPPGRYEGELLILTSDPSAPWVPFRFALERSGLGGADESGEDADAGADTSEDVGADGPDVEADSAVDVLADGLGDGVSVDTSGDDFSGDASPAEDVEDASGSSGGGRGGGCGVAGRHSERVSGLLWGVVLLVIGRIRGREARFGRSAELARKHG